MTDVSAPTQPAAPSGSIDERRLVSDGLQALARLAEVHDRSDLAEPTRRQGEEPLASAVDHIGDPIVHRSHWAPGRTHGAKRTVRDRGVESCGKPRHAPGDGANERSRISDLIWSHTASPGVCGVRCAGATPARR